MALVQSLQRLQAWKRLVYKAASTILCVSRAFSTESLLEDLACVYRAFSAESLLEDLACVIVCMGL